MTAGLPRLRPSPDHCPRVRARGRLHRRRLRSKVEPEGFVEVPGLVGRWNHHYGTGDRHAAPAVARRTWWTQLCVRGFERSRRRPPRRHLYTTNSDQVDRIDPNDLALWRTERFVEELDAVREGAGPARDAPAWPLVGRHAGDNIPAHQGPAGRGLGHAVESADQYAALARGYAEATTHAAGAGPGSAEQVRGRGDRR